jgi:hypothetical protein
VKLRPYRVDQACAFADSFKHPLLQAVLLPSTAPALILAIQNLLG